jgi:hypothetical protein
MLNEILWHWLYTGNATSAFLLVLMLLMAATCGATLASLVTCIEAHLGLAGQTSD